MKKKRFFVSFLALICMLYVEAKTHVLQADIFSTRIQMTCQMDFDFATNSSLLNTWTRTPLELSGILETKTLDTKYLCFFCYSANIFFTKLISVYY